MMLGSTPDVPFATISTSGVTPSSCAFVADMMTSAAAPSLMPDALPAVTVPSFLNAGRKRLSVSTDVPARGNSS